MNRESQVSTYAHEKLSKARRALRGNKRLPDRLLAAFEGLCVIPPNDLPADLRELHQSIMARYRRPAGAPADSPAIDPRACIEALDELAQRALELDIRELWVRAKEHDAA